MKAFVWLTTTLFAFLASAHAITFATHGEWPVATVADHAIDMAIYTAIVVWGICLMWMSKPKP